MNKRMPEWLTTLPIAHRGLQEGYTIPENSIASFENACEAPCAIELDVRLLADHSLIVFHDEDLHRLTGYHGKVEGQTRASIENLRLYDTNQRIPTMQEVFRVVDGRVPLLIELKTNPLQGFDLEIELLKLLADYQGAYALQSFNPFSMEFLYRHAPHIVRGQLSSGHEQAEMSERERLTKATPDFIAYALPSLPSPPTTELRTGGIPLLAWTIQTAEQQQKALHCADNYIFEHVDPKAQKLPGWGESA